MQIFILTMVIMMGNTGHPTIVISQEYHSKKTCEHAMNEYTKQLEKNKRRIILKGCYEK